jgi:methylenetetrahydrofolate reductase (NADPH)
MVEQLGKSPDFAERLPSMVLAAKIEIVPSETILARIDRIPPGSQLSVTASPTKEIVGTIDMADKLSQKGYIVIPHLAARRIRNLDHLKQISDILERSQISEVFVIGGDKDPFGEYSNSSKMLEDLLKINHTIKSVGVAGYPEGHPLISDSAIIQHLKTKIAIAEAYGVEIHINSQACYDPTDVTTWIHKIHEIHASIPIYLGIAAPISKLKLIQFSLESGVGDSIAFLQMVGIGSALESALYDPVPFIHSLTGKPETEQVKGFHLFTFNHIKAATEWQKNFKLGAP